MERRIFKLLDYLKESILDIIFESPYKCIVCNEIEADGICNECLKTIRLCTEDEYYGYYKGALKDLIHLFKFKKDFLAGDILVNMLESKIKNIDKEYILTYIPIGKESMKKRGFNQCEYIAKKLSKRLDLEYKETIIKCKNTKIQKELSKNERKENIKNSFKVKDTKYVAGKKFVLIDDVITTGATIEEGIKVLKESGANEIKILTIAKSRI